ncbi:unnamed protein product, partial [Meganyctiphanes norvegica]
QDAHHKFQECDRLYTSAVANWYLTTNQQLQIPDGLLKEAHLVEGLKFDMVSKLAKYSSEKSLMAIVCLLNERLAFPLTIHHALKNLKIGDERKALSEINSLNIHIIHKTPMLDPRMWEFFFHQLPNLKQLNLVFLSGAMKLYNKFNSYLPVERCSDCKGKERVITYNIQPMYYQHYFSSDDYIQPDVVVVFDIAEELFNCQTLCEMGMSPECISITYSKSTIVVLASYLEDVLEECVKNFHVCRPVKTLLPIQENPVCGISSCHGFDMVNKNFHICCIQGTL